MGIFVDQLSLVQYYVLVDQFSDQRLTETWFKLSSDCSFTGGSCFPKLNFIVVSQIIVKNTRLPGTANPGGKAQFGTSQNAGTTTGDTAGGKKKLNGGLIAYRKQSQATNNQTPLT